MYNPDQKTENDNAILRAELKALRESIAASNFHVNAALELFRANREMTDENVLLFTHLKTASDSSERALLAVMERIG